MSLDSALAFVLRWEGGYVNDPDDPGGATNKGITQRVYDAWRLRRGQPPQPVRLINDFEVRDIYTADYWLAAHCDRARAPVDLVMFDTAVNMGVGRAVRFLQGALALVEDGDFGPATLAAVQGDANPKGTAVSFCDRRERYYRDLAKSNPRLAKFLNGWLNRLADLRRTALT